jgi:hypothetical protein
MAGVIRRQMGPIRKRITNQLITAGELCQTDISTEERSELLKNSEILLDKLKRNFAAYEKLQDKLQELALEDEEETNKLEEEAENYGDLILEINEASVHIEQFITTLKNSTYSGLTTPTPIQRQITVKLPKLELPKYNGDPLKWRAFWDAFHSSIASNPSLSDIDKFNYLRCQLVGDAKSALEGLELTTTNYATAIDLLKDRFGNSQTVINAHYTALMDMNKASDSTNRLRFVFDNMEKHLRSLEALGEDINHGHFIPLIMSKFPREIILRLEELKASGNWTTSTLRQTLKKIVESKEAADRQAKPDNHQAGLMKSGSSKQEKLYSTTDSLLNQERKRNSAKMSSPRCLFCDCTHWSDECPTFKSLTDRKNKVKGRCFVCLRKGHVVQDCNVNKACFHCNQRKNHHRSLCPRKFTSQSSQSDSQSSEIATNVVEKDEEALVAGEETVLLQTANAPVINITTSKSLRVSMILDSGSQRTYITENLTQRLNLPIKGKEGLSIFTFGSGCAKNITTSIVDLAIGLIDGTSMTITANVVPKITGKIQNSSIDKKNLTFLQKKLPFADSITCSLDCPDIQLLIGIDYFWDIITSERMEVKNGLYLIGSKLGWFLTGRMTKETVGGIPDLSLLTYIQPSVLELPFHTVDSPVNEDINLKEWWELETIGIKESPSKSDDETVLEHFQDTVQYKNGRYFVRFPWKEHMTTQLPDNYGLALGRLKTLIKRFSGSPNIIEQYNSVIEDQLKKGIVERVGPDSPRGHKLHYLPHHAVIKPSHTTTKIRIVYDGSAKTKKGNKSINECLYRGPVILEDLCGLIMRFRLKKIAIVSDIEKAFLQVGLQTLDRDVTRFLWLKDPTKLTVENNLEVYRFSRVPFGVISSPFLLGATIKCHLLKQDTELSRVIANNIYVDNVFAGTSSVEEAVRFYQEAKEIFKLASMNLREWSSNSDEFLEKIPFEDRTIGDTVKILGISWKRSKDTLNIVSSYDDSIVPKTKREVLKAVSSIFDPLGWFGPAMLMPKRFLQELWNAKLDWDDELDDIQQKSWKEVSQYMRNISDMNILRYIGPTEGKSSVKYTLHCFADASQVAYSAVIYLRLSRDKSSNCWLLFAKTRLAPRKEISITRLELLAVLIGSRIFRFVKFNLGLKIEEGYLWTDSKCVLHWIHSKKLLPVFIERRIVEITSIQDLQFRYVPTSTNPADIATRGLSAADLHNTQLWWQGPHWLELQETNWPMQDMFTCEDSKKLSSIETEMDNCRVFYEVANLVKNKPEDIVNNSICSPFLLVESQFSSLLRLLRITAWSYRFVQRIRRLTNSTEGLTAQEIAFAKRKWEWYVQRKFYPEVVFAITKNTTNLLKDQLSLYLDENGIMRCRGRLINAQISYDAKFPKLLPKESYFTTLIILHYHRKFFHVGVSHTLSQLRQEYWIPKGRAAVYQVIRKCKDCLRFNGGPYKMPNMPAYPKMRVEETTPFLHTGLDYFGPLFVKVGSKVSKVWVCLFTCLVIRGVHLEVINDLSAEEFIMCLRRFIARRGKPNEIISDNALQFKLAKSVIDVMWNSAVSDSEAKSYLANHNIKWTFITQLAPWMGGFYERLIAIVKNSLRKSIGKLCLTLCQLQTILTEIESVLNSRPLTYVGTDFQDGEVLSPSKFLMMKGDGFLDVSDPVKKDNLSYIREQSKKGKLLQLWKKGQSHLRTFWNIWREEYLTSLRERTQSRLKGPRVTAKICPEVGQIVQVKDCVPRGRWKLARITKLIQSRDGKIRAAEILLPSGNTTKRALNCLYPLECDEEDIQVAGVSPVTN